MGVIAENNNRAILQNTFILYIRLLVVSVCGLLTTRYALQALGVSDFGLFSVVGGVVSFMAIFNTIMLSTSNRFIAIAIGKNDINEINSSFNVNLLVHVVIAVVTMMMAIPVGNWYIANYINFDGDINLAIKVFNVTIIGSVISFVGVPFNGLLMAKERFFVFCFTDMISSVLKMIGAWSLLYFFEDKLMAYAMLLSVLSAYPTLVFLFYCKCKFPDYVRYRLVRDRKRYHEVFKFSIWVGYGALATMGKNQGSALIVNNFFNTIMNAALGIANMVNNIVHVFAANMTKSIAPQITKTYASGDMSRCERLVIFASKVSFMGLFVISSPFFAEPEWILSLWLGEVPPYTVIFIQLLLVDALVGSLNSGIPEVIFASGKIKCYQLIVNSIFLFSIFVAWMVLHLGAPAYMMIVVYIIFSLVVLIVRQVVLNRVVKFNNWRLIRESYLPALLVVLFSCPLFFINVQPIVNVGIVLLGVVVVIYFIGFNKQERNNLRKELVR